MAGRIEGGRAQAAGLVERAVRAFLAAQRVTRDADEYAMLDA